MQSPNSHQVGGTHYQAPFQHWDFVLECLEGRYLEGNITKYVCRWRKKNGLLDLRKSIQYLDKLLTEVQGGPSDPMPLALFHTSHFVARLDYFCRCNGLTEQEQRVMSLVSDWSGLEDLVAAKELLESMALREAVAHEASQVSAAQR